MHPLALHSREVPIPTVTLRPAALLASSAALTLLPHRAWLAKHRLQPVTSHGQHDRDYQGG